MLNRAAVILKYRGPAVRWINEADPYNEDPGISAESLMEERTIYLISEDDEHGGDRGHRPGTGEAGLPADRQLGEVKEDRKIGVSP